MSDDAGGTPLTPTPPGDTGGSIRRDTGDTAASLQGQMRSAKLEFENHVAHARAEFEEANARIQQRTGRNLILATLIGVGVGGVVLASLIFEKWPFVLVGIAIAVLGTFELTRALQAAGRKVDIVPQLVGGLLVLLSAYYLDIWLSWIALFAAVALVIVCRLLGQMAARDGRTYASVLDDVLVAGFVQLYVPFLASLCLVLLRQENGEWWVLSFLIVAIAADTGAYAAGLAFGKHPMAPRISPKKTWEGFAGAVVASGIAGVLLMVLLVGMPWWTGVVFGIVILLTATVGDLGESMVKRDLGIKDMSSWLPGHGGVLDRLDSILPSAVAALALYYVLSPLAVS